MIYMIEKLRLQHNRNNNEHCVIRALDTGNKAWNPSVQLYFSNRISKFLCLKGLVD